MRALAAFVFHLAVVVTGVAWIGAVVVTVAASLLFGLSGR